ncbi:hypothetical protein Rsub_06688 [Raphidocelis subcapitata]|uniref:Borealin N-terminal domain-containing protein n=1 Tax=Raphidocelis subcapitata TaxID=307507 RepID=A0A2V0P9J7_9CHLO|nr:hypothetical protein Rsub_06688 [Raphidocelis subcapitata]|eukprot:GBF94573.1 hypothetical protein Rsub_06688 [Raphidocelis subcapitata]
MPPRKRKQQVPGEQQEGPAEGQQPQPDRDEIARRIAEKLAELDRAVEQRCQDIADAASEIVDNFMQEFRIQLIGVPKQMREMAWSEYGAGREAAPTRAAEARVESILAEAQEASMATVAGAPRTTRAGRGRGRGADAVAEPPATGGRTTRRGAAAAPAAAAAAAAAAVAPRQAVPRFEAPGVAPIPEGPEAASPSGAPAEAEPAAAAAAAPGDGAQEYRAPGAGGVSGAEARAQARIDAKLAAVGGGGGRRTVARGVQPGEALFSARGSPLSVLLGGNAARTRGAAAPQPLQQVGLTPAHAPAHTSAVGCVTLLKREAPAVAAGAAAARGRGRGRRREVVQPDAAIMITTGDGHSFMVDGSADALAAIPESHRSEVQQQLVMLQRLAASALGVGAA